MSRRILEGQVKIEQWPVARTARSGPKQDVKLWRSFLDEVRCFEHAKFSIVRGCFMDATAHQYETDMVFSGLARLRSGTYVHVNAGQKVCWANYSPAGEELYRKLAYRGI